MIRCFGETPIYSLRAASRELCQSTCTCIHTTLEPPVGVPPRRRVVSCSGFTDPTYRYRQCFTARLEENIERWPPLSRGADSPTRASRLGWGVQRTPCQVAECRTGPVLLCECP